MCTVPKGEDGMATVVFSLSGEGRGHAARARVLVELLRQRHRIIVYAYGAGLEMLAPLYENTEVDVRAIPGMRFVYDRNGTLNRPLSLLGAVPFLSHMGMRAAALAREIERLGVDLVIADFEPLLPRAAHIAKIPCMSVDHQQFLTSYDLSCLPKTYQDKVSVIAPFVRPYYKTLRHAVISAFFFPPLKKAQHPITQVGVLLRKEVLEAEPMEGDHLVAYVRRRAPGHVLRALSECDRRVCVYGHDRVGRVGNLHFKSIDHRAFVEDLAGAHALITTAGNQVVGESLALKKPVLAYPEPGNFEQHINGFFLENSRLGWSREAHLFDASLLCSFTAAVPDLRDRIRPERLNGNRPTELVVEAEIARATHLGRNAPRALEGRTARWSALGARKITAELR